MCCMTVLRQLATCLHQARRACRYSRPWVLALTVTNIDAAPVPLSLPSARAAAYALEANTDYPGCFIIDSYSVDEREGCALACAANAMCAGATFGDNYCKLLLGVLGGVGCPGVPSGDVDTYRMLPPGPCPGGTHKYGDSSCVWGERSPGFIGRITRANVQSGDWLELCAVVWTTRREHQPLIMRPNHPWHTYLRADCTAANCTMCPAGPNGSCTECAAGSYLSGNGTCLSCPGVCTSCTSATDCTECASGWKPYDGACSERGVPECFASDGGRGARGREGRGREGT
jgi:hypothetical protein